MTRTVRKLDNWKVWVGVAYFGLALTVVWLFFLNQSQSRVQAHQARDEAVRTAEADSAAVAQRTQCLASIPSLGRINRFVAGVKDLHSVLERNSHAVFLATPKDDPAYAVRKANWLRVKSTVSKVSGVHFPVPTVKQCKALGPMPDVR